MSQAKICWELLTEQSLLYWPLLIKTDTLIKTSPIIFVLWYRFINLDRLNSFSCSTQSKEYFYDLETWCLVYGRRHLRKDGDFCWFLQLPAEIFYWPSFSGVKVTSELWKVSNWQMLSSKRCKGSHPLRKVQFFLTLFKRPLNPPPPFIWTFVLFCRGCFLKRVFEH